ncbi:MAG: formate dehydrogenase subunit delta [Burkholderiaceae bacterium]|nr:formate dehydrogenase subunit delta [Roseateles sp.]MBV8469212.1 formate dehydrogenase subunit delta [Burkholderiaceae bacterium]
MDLQNLIHMANRIGEFFQSMPDVQEAEAGVAEHLAKFWEPRMLRLLLAHLDESGAPTLMPLVRDAVLQHRASLAPR